MTYIPPNPNGQATKANSSPVVIASDDDLQAKLGIVTETAPATDTASSGLNGRLQRVAQRLTSLIALLPTSLGANGGLKIEGVASGTAVPISGSVTANAGTNLNTSALALETGGNLASVATNTTNIPNTIGTAASAIPTKLIQVGGSDGTNARAIKTNTSGQMDIRPLTTSDAITATLSAETTKVIGTVRNLGNAGDIFDQATGSAVPANAVQVGFSDGTNLRAGTVNSTTTTSKFAQDNNLLSLAGTLVDTNSGSKSAGTQRIVIATDQPALTNAQPANITQVGGSTQSGTNPLYVSDVATNSGGMSWKSFVSAASNNKASVGAACRLFFISIQNISSAPVYLKCFNAASGSVTAGTTACDFQFMCPANSTAANGAGVVLSFDKGIAMSTDFTYMLTTGIGTTDNTSTSASVAIVTLGYK